MSVIWTIKGFLPEAELTRTEGVVDNENEYTTWEEWRDDTGEIVKRNVHVRLKRGHGLPIEQGMLG